MPQRDNDGAAKGPHEDRGFSARLRRSVKRCWDKQDNFRHRVDYYLNATAYGAAIEAINVVISSAAVVLYCVATYYVKTEKQSEVKLLEKLDEIQTGFGYFFLAEFIIRLYAAESPMSHLRKPLTLIDIFTVFPPYVGQILTFVSRKIAEQGGEGSELSQDDLGVVGDLDFLRVVRLMRLLRIITFIQGRSAQNKDVSAHILRITLTFFSVMFCFAGFYMEVERAYTADIDIHFHDALYFTIVTVSSVGYGEYSPQSWTAKMIVMCMICIALVFVGDQLGQLMRFLSMHCPYSRATYTKKRHSCHIIVSGNFSYNSITDFLGEMFHNDHGDVAQQIIVILMAEEAPSLSMLAILEDGKYVGRIRYLRGSILQDKDLERAHCSAASCIFLLCNKDSMDPKASDQATVLRAMAAKKYLRKTGSDDILVIMQMILPDSRQFFSRSRYGDSNHQIVCVDEIKLNLLAKSCICPGFSTMVSNLVRSSNLEASSSMDTWAQEYTLGCGKEIYRAKLSPFFSGKTFSEMANLVFSHLGVCVLAVEIMDAAGVQRAVLFPAKYMIPSSSTFVFLIGEDVTDAHRVSNFKLIDGVLEITVSSMCVCVCG